MEKSILTREEVIKLADFLADEYGISKKATHYLSEKIAPITEEIISIMEREKLSYVECYSVLNFTYKTLKFKSEQVHL